MIDGFNPLQIQLFTLKIIEEALHDNVVVAVALAAHALHNAVLNQYPAVLLVLVVSALVGLQNLVMLLSARFDRNNRIAVYTNVRSA